MTGLETGPVRLTGLGKRIAAVLAGACLWFAPGWATAQTAPDTARILGDSAARLYQRAGSFYQDRSSRAELDSALALYRAALALYGRAGQPRGEAGALDRMGLVQRRLGYTDSALSYHRQALTAARAGADSVREAAVLTNLSVAYRIVGRQDSALAAVRASLLILRAVGDRQRQFPALNSMARIYEFLGALDSSLAYGRAALRLARELGNRQFEVGALNNLGITQENLGRSDSALAYYSLALPIRRELGDRAGEARTLTNIGNLQAGQERIDSALASYRQALALAREIQNRVQVPGLLQNLGSLYQGHGQLDSAQSYYHEALAGHRAAAERRAEAHVLHGLGLTYHQLTQGRKDTLLLRRAVAYYDSAAAVHAALATSAGSDFNRVSWLEQSVRLFEQWTGAWLDRGAELGPRAAALGALAVAERGRARGLLSLIRAAKPEGLAIGLSFAEAAGADLVAEGTALVESLARADAAALAFLASRDTLIAWLILPGGDVQVIRQAVSRDSLARLVGGLRAGLGLDQAAVATQLALRGAASFEPVANAGDFPRGQRYADRAARALAQILLPADLLGRLGSTSELVIVPQGPLALIPFAVLPADAADAPLGARIALRYVPSLTAMGESTRPGATGAPTTRALQGALVVGNPTMPRISASDGADIALAPLPGAATEARWLARRLGVEALVADRATETEVRSRLGRAPLVHFATHGYAYASEARAHLSFVALAPGGSDDGLLTVSDLLNGAIPMLTADLVVLSACQTGLGDLKQAEGSIGLQRALLARGARSVLVSLWSVSDAATELLMIRFYTHWLDDRDRPGKAEALRRAQDDVRSTPGFDHPRFWAAFQLVGAG